MAYSEPYDKIESNSLAYLESEDYVWESYKNATEYLDTSKAQKDLKNWKLLYNSVKAGLPFMGPAGIKAYVGLQIGEAVYGLAEPYLSATE